MALVGKTDSTKVPQVLAGALAENQTDVNKILLTVGRTSGGKGAAARAVGTTNEG